MYLSGTCNRIWTWLRRFWILWKRSWSNLGASSWGIKHEHFINEKLPWRNSSSYQRGKTIPDYLERRTACFRESCHSPSWALFRSTPANMGHSPNSESAAVAETVAIDLALFESIHGRAAWIAWVRGCLFPQRIDDAVDLRSLRFPQCRIALVSDHDQAAALGEPPVPVIGVVFNLLKIVAGKGTPVLIRQWNFRINVCQVP